MKHVTPDWFKKSAVYQINPRTFCEEGTIKAVTKELPVLAELGFKIMYLCPIFEEDASEDRSFWSDRQKKSETENPKNPYRMNDYYKIDDEYGTMDDLREFVAEAHKLGLKVFLDLVYLHIGPNAPILKIHPEFTNLDEDGNIILGRWHFPLFNYESLGAREYLWGNMVYYIGAIDVDGFRCDVGDEVPLDFWEEGVRRIKAIKPDAVMINEGVKADYLTVFDANYGFPWHTSLHQILRKEIVAADVIAKYNEISGEYPVGGLVLRDMDNHDTATDWPYRIEKHFGHDCMELILAINYTIDGVPMVYCGNDIADTTRHSMFANRFHRGVYEVADRNAKGEAVDRRKEIVKTLNSLKREVAVLSEGETEWTKTDSDYILAFDRISDTEKVTFIGNFSDECAEIEAPNGEILLSNNAEIKDGKIKLSKYGYAIIRR